MSSLIKASRLLTCLIRVRQEKFLYEYDGIRINFLYFVFTSFTSDDNNGTAHNDTAHNDTAHNKRTHNTVANNDVWTHDVWSKPLYERGYLSRTSGRYHCFTFVSVHPVIPGTSVRQVCFNIENIFLNSCKYEIRIFFLPLFTIPFPLEPYFIHFSCATILR